MEIHHQVDEAFWWDIARQCDYATFFHTPLWHKLALTTFPEYQDATLGAVLDNGVNVVLPLIQMPGNSLFHTRISTFAACYGGFVANGELGAAEQTKMLETATTQRTSLLRIISNPTTKNELPSQIFSSQREDFTHIITLDTDFETIFSRFTKGHRSGARKGQRLGVTVRLARDLQDYQQYFEAYLDSLARWGDDVSSRYPWELFANGFALSQEYPNQIKLWLAELEGKVIAGAWVFYWNQHVDWWHGAAFADYFQYNANNVLQATIIKDAIERGYRYYDFNPSGGHEGVARSKKHYGAEEWPVYRYALESPVHRMKQRIKAVLKQ